MEEYNKMSGKLKSLQNIYNTTLKYHSTYENETTEKIEGLTTANIQSREQLSRIEKDNAALMQH